MLRRRWWVVSLAVAAGIVGAYAATAQAPHIYETSMSFYLAAPNGLPDGSITPDVAGTRIATYRALAKSPQMMQEAAGTAGSGGTVTVTGSDSPLFMSMNTTADSADGAYALAQAYADEFPAFAASFEGSPAGSPPLVLFEAPTKPGAPISPDARRNVLVGLALGLVIGIVAMFVLEMSDRKVRTADQATQAAGLRLLASVPHETVKGARRALGDTGSRRAEATRQLRTNVWFAGGPRVLRSLIVASPSGREGKTSTAVDLAITCARAGQRVLLVDADLRRPGVSRELGLGNTTGLVDLLTSSATLDDVLQTWGEDFRLSVLASGPVPTNPSELLGSERFDLVIYDSAPILPVTDALTLAPALDGVLLVARIDRTRRDQLRRAASVLAELDLRVIGLVCQDDRDEARSGYIRIDRNRPAVPATHTALTPMRRSANGAAQRQDRSQNQ